MQVTHTIAETRNARRGWGAIAFVPTMGALHEGHISLIHRARQLAPHTVVSIFVNPTQFGPSEDFSRYPRPVERDLRVCHDAGADMVFQPTVDEVYPPEELETIIDIPPLTGILEGAHRPGHFVGVCRVVAKLFNIVQPDVACFGMKDYQQLRVIESMAAAMAMPVRVERCPTLREPDGLAMSSRNIYLDPARRRHALGLSKALREAEHAIRQGESGPASIESLMRQVIQAHHFELDYAVIRDAKTLAPVDILNPVVEPLVCLVAGKLGNVRLIDSAVVDGS